jgi:hypothetical protein
MALSNSSLSPPSSQPSGRRLLSATGSSTNPSSLQTRLSHRLNPDATPNTPSSTLASAQEGDLPEWLIFSLSSSEGRSSQPGCRHGVSPKVSYAKMVWHKEKAPMEEAGSSVVRPEYGTPSVPYLLLSLRELVPNNLSSVTPN